MGAVGEGHDYFMVAVTIMMVVWVVPLFLLLIVVVIVVVVVVLMMVVKSATEGDCHKHSLSSSPRGLRHAQMVNNPNEMIHNVRVRKGRNYLSWEEEGGWWEQR